MSPHGLIMTIMMTALMMKLMEDGGWLMLLLDTGLLECLPRRQSACQLVLLDDVIRLLPVYFKPSAKLD